MYDGEVCLIRIMSVGSYYEAILLVFKRLSNFYGLCLYRCMGEHI